MTRISKRVGLVLLTGWILPILPVSAAYAEHPASKRTFNAIARYVRPSARTIGDHLQWVKVSNKGPYALAHLAGGQPYFLLLKHKKVGWRGIADLGYTPVPRSVPKAVVADLHLKRHEHI